MFLRCGREPTLSASILEWDNHHQPSLVADGPSRVPLTGKIFRQNNVAGPEAMHAAIAQPDLHRAGERNHVLTAGCVMPIWGRSGRHLRETDAGDRLQWSLLRELSGRKRQLQAFQMRLLIVTAIQSKKTHWVSPLQIGSPK